MLCLLVYPLVYSHSSLYPKQHWKAPSYPGTHVLINLVLSILVHTCMYKDTQYVCWHVCMYSMYGTFIKNGQSLGSQLSDSQRSVNSRSAVGRSTVSQSSKS